MDSRTTPRAAKKDGGARPRSRAHDRLVSQVKATGDIIGRSQTIRPGAGVPRPATGLLIPRLSQGIPRSISHATHDWTVLRQLVDAGAVKLTDKFKGDSPQTAYIHAVEDGFEKLLTRPRLQSLGDFGPTQLHQNGVDEYHFSSYPGGMGSSCTALEPLYRRVSELIGFNFDSLKPIKEKPRGKKLVDVFADKSDRHQVPIALRWVAYVFNQHHGIAYPAHNWKMWMDQWFDAGTLDHDGGEWHEADKDDPATIERENKMLAEWEQIRLTHWYVIKEEKLPQYTDQVVAQLRKQDPKLADILLRMERHPKSTIEGLEITEPVMTYCWRDGDVLDHCWDHIQYNLHEGNIQINDPFFTCTGTIPELVKQVDELERIVAPMVEIEAYIRRLKK